MRGIGKNMWTHLNLFLLPAAVEARAEGWPGRCYVR
jgi:hypothetical protein